ncbi:MAG: tetratricopeptide repeat protein [Chthoniobacterales bacterium]
MRRRILAVVVLGTSPLFAQDPTPEVRQAIPLRTPPRAQPVNPADATETPVEVRRAEPLNQPTPIPLDAGPAVLGANSNAYPKATPNLIVPPKPMSAREDDQTPATPPTVETNQGREIRIAPSNGAGVGSAAADLLEVANGFYSRKLYDLAVPEYEKYLSNYPGAPGRQSAIFRLGECYRALGNPGVAVGYYQKLLTEFASGEFLGAASYRLAEIYYGQKRFDEAITLYRKAAANAKNADLTLSARYFEARGLEETGRRAEARLVFQDIISIKERNPYKTAARLALARYAEETGAKEEALGHYAQLANETERNELRGEALIHAGSLSGALGKLPQAKAYFQKAIDAPGTGNWRPLARLGLMKLSYDAGDYAGAVSMYESGAANQGGVAPADVMILAANAYRQLNRNSDASALYEQVITGYPDTPESREAGYQRLLALASANDAGVITAINDYLSQNPSGERPDKARLLKAEYFYKNKRYPEAAKVYQDVGKILTDRKLQAECLYRAGWCYSQANDWPKTIDAMGEFIEAFPQHENAPKALVQRGFASLKLRAYTDALRDFDKLIQNYPKAPERELALTQKALAEGQQDDNVAMAATFRQLLKEYPKTESKAQASYYIGWATFEAKNFADAIDPLTTARDLDPKSYFDDASVRIILANYYLEKLEPLSREIDFYKAKDGKRGLPGEIYSWLGTKYYHDGNFAKAARYLELHIANIPGDPDTEIYYLLGDAARQQQDWDKARKNLDLYLTKADGPALKARGLIAYSKLELTQKNFAAARTRCSDALNLQPEGRLNAEGRMQAGDIDFAEGKFENAAKNYLSISVLYEDAELTPLALEKAALSYSKSGNTAESQKANLELKDRYPDYKPTLAKLK